MKEKYYENGWGFRSLVTGLGFSGFGLLIGLLIGFNNPFPYLLIMLGILGFATAHIEYRKEMKENKNKKSRKR